MQITISYICIVYLLVLYNSFICICNMIYLHFIKAHEDRGLSINGQPPGAAAHKKVQVSIIIQAIIGHISACSLMV